MTYSYVRDQFVTVAAVGAVASIVAATGFVVGAGFGVGVCSLSGGGPSAPQSVHCPISGDAPLERGGDEAFAMLDCPLDEQTQKLIYFLSKSYGVDFPLVMGLIERESSFNPSAISETGDFGLMQINTVNREMLEETLGITDLLDPGQNVRAGLFILGGLLERHHDPAKALMAYNLGESGAKVLWDKGICETGYTSRVLESAAKFEAEMANGRQANAESGTVQ